MNVGQLPPPSALDGVDVPALADWLRDQREAMLDDLAAYVGHETPSTDKGLLDTGLGWLEDWLGERLGPARRRAHTDGGRFGDVVVLDYPGAEGTTADQPLVLLCHYDTVWERGTLAGWPFTRDGDRLSGPGVFDMKAGLVQAGWAVRALDALGLPRPPLRLVLNGDEEIGSPASRPVIEAAVPGASAVLVFEASAGGAVKTARKGVGIFEVAVRGVEAHAGLEPTKGVSAVDELARAVLALHGMGDLARGTSVNVGVVRGGTRGNVVAGEAGAAVDVRVSSVEEAARIDRALAGLAPTNPRAALEVTGGWNRPVMERTPQIAAAYDLARAAAARLGVDLAECAVGGASDGNFAAALGLPVLDGLGAVGDGAHARHEHASLAGMVERAAVAAALMAALGR